MKLTLITATHHRAETLARQALPSVLTQTNQNFEWVLVNDGGDRWSKKVVTQAIPTAQFPIKYVEMEHPTEGFGLCHARNLGLSHATGEIVAYLDDDNALSPNFVQSTLQFFQDNPLVRCSMPRQQRRRDIVKDGFVVKRGKTFVSPKSGETEALICLQEIFDSNGFAHYLIDAPRWNPDYRVFADYEYFLQYISQYQSGSFTLNPEVLVNYIQSSTGVIGMSSYSDWARELKQIQQECWRYTVLDNSTSTRLALVIKSYEMKSQNNLEIPAFSCGE